jgi:HK97 family phage prohead protease
MLIPIAAMEKICPGCAANMRRLGMTSLDLAGFREMDPEALAGLCDTFAPADGFFGRCTEAMQGEVDDPDVFCAWLHEQCVGKSPSEESKALKIGDREIRSSAAEFRLVEADGQPTILTGYAAVFNQPSEPLGSFREIIRPGAFADSIKAGDDVRMLFNHNPDSVMARTGKNLTLTEDDTGLRIEATLDPADFDAHRVLGKVKAGLVTQMSFGFETKEEKWTGDMKKTLRELVRAKLFDVSPATFPAYPQTTVQARDRLRAFLETAQADITLRRRRLDLAEKRLL